MKQHKIKSAAFTLVELMVSIVIIGVLASIAVVGYNKYVLSARVAEATVGIDALSKAQVTNFISNKRFRQTLNPGRVPRKRAYPIVQNSSWANLSNPIAPGVMTYFQHQARSGKTDGAGNNVMQGDSGGSYPVGDSLMIPNFTSWALLDTPSFAACNRFSGRDYITTSGKAHYQWTILTVTGNLKENIDNTGQWDDCTELLRVIDTDASGKIKQGGIIRKNIGS